MKNLKLFSVLILAVMLLLPQAAGAATGDTPAAGGYTQMCYDSESQVLVLYGGQQTGDYQDPANYLHETWTFDPVTYVWTKMFPSTSPGGSSGGYMIYDSRADRCILSIVDDNYTELQTWAYDVDTNTWEQLADGPRVMVGQRLVYNSKADRTILFGGYGPPWTFGQGILDETWAYNYNTNTWTNMNPRHQPAARNYQGMAYDSRADRVVMWGKVYYHPNKDLVWTYDYNTNTWQSFAYTNGPGMRDYIDLVYDARADRIIMYGGYDYGSTETWTYNLNTHTWKQMQPLNNPGARSRYSMVYVKDLNKAILYGGQDGPTYDIYKTDTWSYSLRTNTWTNIAPGQ
jgi:hypothetical protein